MGGSRTKYFWEGSGPSPSLFPSRHSPFSSSFLLPLPSLFPVLPLEADPLKYS